MACDKVPVYSFKWKDKQYFFCMKHGGQIAALIEIGVFFGELIPLERFQSEILSCSEKVKDD